jgi:hypothetical protein
VLGGLFALAFILAFLGLIFSWGNSAALATTVAILAGALVIVAILPQLSEFSFGPKGISGKVSQLQNEIEKTKDQVKGQEAIVRQQGEQLAKQQEIINELVKYSMSASIFHHFCGIALLHTYIYHDGDSNRREMYFLRDNGFIKPKGGGFLDFNQDLDNKNVVDIAEPTPVGWSCIRLRKGEIPSNMLQDKGNLRVDVSVL